MNIDKFILLFLSVTFYANDVAIETITTDVANAIISGLERIYPLS